MEEFGRYCCIRGYHVYGYHVYKMIWREAIGEELECDQEPENSCGVKRSEVIVGHLPRKLSRVCSLFLRAWRCNSMYGDWRTQYSGDLHSGKANLSDQADRPWA